MTNQSSQLSKTCFYSIGYGNRSVVQLFDLIKSFGCSYLVDVRSVPYSKYHTQYNRENLEKSCNDFGLHYLYLGDQVGGKPPSDEFRNALGLADYELMAQTPNFVAGLTRLQNAYNKGIAVALMCAELKPEVCHRTNLIGNSLAKLGIDLVHIDESAQPISHSEALHRASGGQGDMFA